MKRISFSGLIPHIVAIVLFFLVTIFFFSPIFFENKALSQGDITQHVWGSKELRDFRSKTGKEGLWAGSMFSGMPSYQVNLRWSAAPIAYTKNALALFLPHPLSNIFLAFLCYYILLLTFRVRPYLAIIGAIAFGLSSYMIIGLAAGHNSRIGAIAFMPLVMAGIHLSFSRKRILGFGVTTAGLSLHLREYHPQITYYLIIIVVAYGLMQLILAFREKTIVNFLRTTGLLIIAAIIAACTFAGPLWASSELSKYSTRGKSELITNGINTQGSGLPKSYAFEYSNGILEPITILIPEFYGGSSFHALVSDPESKTYQALMQSGDQNMANQLAQYSSSYWGDQPISAPYYAGAVIVFLFVFGIMTAEKKYVWWLVSISVFAVILSWGSSFKTFNYFIFDYLPGYNMFRSVTFAMVIVFFAMPLLGMMGLERLAQNGLDKKTKKQLIIAFAATGGLCLLFFLLSGALDYSKEIENQLPAWYLNALRADRAAMLRGDALRSFGFIFCAFILLFLNGPKKISLPGFSAVLIIMVILDLVLVDKRYFTKDNYKRKSDNSNFEATPADEFILKDESNYRVFNLADFYEARTSSFHQSLGGYHGVRIKRYQELYDSCISRERDELIGDAQAGELDFKRYGVLNMLNAKYFVYGPDANNVIQNPEANGSAWFVKEIQTVKIPNDELTKTGEVDTKSVAVLDDTKFKIQNLKFDTDSLSEIKLIERSPLLVKYESHSNANGFAIFSEVYYPKGWKAAIDGKEVPILRADYVLRALEVPAGDHKIEFTFQPESYTIGNKITMASSWIFIIVVLGSIGWNFRKE